MRELFVPVVGGFYLHIAISFAFLACFNGATANKRDSRNRNGDAEAVLSNWRITCHRRTIPLVVVVGGALQQQKSPRVEVYEWKFPPRMNVAISNKTVLGIIRLDGSSEFRSPFMTGSWADVSLENEINYDICQTHSFILHSGLEGYR